MNLVLRGNKVAVEKVRQAAKGNATFLKMPDSDEYIGVVRFVGSAAASDLKVGQKVYFGTNHQNAKIAGMDLCVMEDSQVLAIIEEK
jgi:co-chaperonin GroES (HSP10)